MKKQTIVNTIMVVTVLLLIAAIVWSKPTLKRAKKPKKQFSYGVSTPKQVQEKFERHASKLMLSALGMAHFAGRIEEALKCSCAEVITIQEENRVQVEIVYDKCGEKK